MILGQSAGKSHKIAVTMLVGGRERGSAEPDRRHAGARASRHAGLMWHQLVAARVELPELTSCFGPFTSRNPAGLIFCKIYMESISKMIYVAIDIKSM